MKLWMRMEKVLKDEKAVKEMEKHLQNLMNFGDGGPVVATAIILSCDRGRVFKEDSVTCEKVDKRKKNGRAAEMLN